MARDTQRENQLRKARKKAFEGAIKEHYIAYQECRLKSNKGAKNPDELLELALEDGDVYDFLFGDYGYPVHGTFDRKIKTDWGVPLNFPYLDYEEMASALVGKQKRDACFRASAEVNRAVLAAIDLADMEMRFRDRLALCHKTDHHAGDLRAELRQRFDLKTAVEQSGFQLLRCNININVFF